MADSMISDGAGKIYTLSGAKLLELPVVCKSLASPDQPVYFRSSIGFSFAGSSLIALNTYATLSTVLSNLGSSSGALPDFGSILEKAKRILMIYASSVRRAAELCLYGICPKSKQPFIGKIIPVISEDGIIDYRIEVHSGLVKKLKVISIGTEDGKVKLDEIIDGMVHEFGEAKTFGYWRIPAYAMEQILKDRSLKTIGGTAQLTILNYSRFDQYWLPNKIGGYSHKFRTLDLDEDIGRTLGGCYVAINGMEF